MRRLPLAGAPVGVVPILWNNVDVPDPGPQFPFAHILDEAVRLGYDGVQHGRGFPEGEALRGELGSRRLRLAELYVALPATVDGPTPEARQLAFDALEGLQAAGGEVLVVAMDGAAERDPWAGRVSPETPALRDDGVARLAELLDELVEAAEVRVAFHPHTGTWIETPEEAERLFAATSIEICLDVGHWTVGGGDPIAALRQFGERVTHLHLKDVDGGVLERLRDGSIGGFGAAIRERLFTELGNGVLDLPAVLAELAARDYAGWVMIEQDSSWLAPAEAAAVGHRIYDFALRLLE